MLLNSSSSHFSVLPPLPHLLSPNSSLSSSFSSCFGSFRGNYVFASFSLTSILLVFPLCITVLHLGCQRRRRRCPMGHCEVITYQMAVMELCKIFGCETFCVGYFVVHMWLKLVGAYVFFITSCGQMMFHVLTCVERYLAVVHPVTYLRLKKGGGVRLRNGNIWVVWLLSFSKISLVSLDSTDVAVTLYMSEEACSLVVTLLCSLSVLRVLMRPRPGAGGGVRDRVGGSKRRAFFTILAVTGPLMLRFTANVVCAVLYSTMLIETSDRCRLIEYGTWFSLPSSLVLPLLFLYRAGKLPHCSHV